MIGWLLDTLVWTGALLALVLLVRRPVARHLGPQAAYALWLIPFARLLMPAIELPAAFAPQAAPAPVFAIDPVLLMTLEANPAPQPDTGWLWIALAFGVWLTGAAVMLAWRYFAYFRMRARLLSEADEKLRIGGVRIVETAATDSPLAFGITDKVIAVPAGFLDAVDKQTRNLAIAHEMAHHERGDLIANFITQPLFALHWFNPLGWLGWRAFRRDQEAACDARVVSDSDAETRAAYAQTIARFSAGPDLALAASMACPVLGEKSIIHRLRSLAMADISPRRRWAGRAALATGLLAMPLTASFSYAVPSGVNETSVAQDQQVDSGAVEIRDVDPDAARLTKEQAEDVAERVEEASDRAEEIAEIAEDVERGMRLVFVQDGRVMSEQEVERRAKEIDRTLLRLKQGGDEDVSIKLKLGEARWVSAEKLAELGKIGQDMERLQLRIENDPEWQAQIGKWQDMTRQILELQLPRMLEIQRELSQQGLIRECRKNDQTIACAGADVRKLQRDAIAEARREIERDRNLSAAQRKRALDALDKARSGN